MLACYSCTPQQYLQAVVAISLLHLFIAVIGEELANVAQQCVS